MQMGVDGCGWVRWGAGGTGNTQTRQAGGIKGHAGQDLGSMAGEISPDIMFWVVCQNRSNVCPDGWRWMQMSGLGCGATGGRKNKAKRARNGQAGHVLGCMVTGKKCIMLARR